MTEEKQQQQRLRLPETDRATGLQVLWQNCKNDLVAARLDAVGAKRQLNTERTKLRQAKDQVTELLSKMTLKDDRVKKLEDDLKKAEVKMTELKEIIISKDVQIAVINREVKSLKENSTQQKKEIDKLKRRIADKCTEIIYTNDELKITRSLLHTAEKKLESFPLNLFYCSKLFQNVNVLISYVRNIKNNILHFPILMLKHIGKLIF